MLAKVICLSLICALISIILKPVKPEYSLLVNLSYGILFVYIVSEPLSEVFLSLGDFSEYIQGGEEIFKRIFRIIIVAYVSEIGAEIARSAGESAIAKKVEIAGRICAAQVVLPIFTLLMSVIKNVL